MKKMIFITLLTVITIISYSKTTLQCKVRYKETGWNNPMMNYSQYYIVNVTFLSGKELGMGWGEDRNLYAVIHWGDKDITILCSAGCGDIIVTNRCLQTIQHNIGGADVNNTQWSICYRETCNP